MRRRNFLTALFAAPFAPWRKILEAPNHFFENQPPTRIDMLDVKKWGTITRLSNVNECFRVGDLVRITSGAGTGEDARIVAIVARDGADIIVTDNPRRMRRFIPPEWKNLARRA